MTRYAAETASLSNEESSTRARKEGKRSGQGKKKKGNREGCGESEDVGLACDSGIRTRTRTRTLCKFPRGDQRGRGSGSGSGARGSTHPDVIDVRVQQPVNTNHIIAAYLYTRGLSPEPTAKASETISPSVANLIALHVAKQFPRIIHETGGVRCCIFTSPHCSSAISASL
jgi:hypothetical protein